MFSSLIKVKKKKFNKIKKIKIKKKKIEPIKLNKNINIPKNIKYLNFKITRRLIIKKILNLIIKKGKKNKAFKILVNILLKIKIITKKSPYLILLSGIKNLKPYVEITKVRKAGKIYEVPVPLTKKKQLFLVLHWMLSAAKLKNKSNFSKALISEIFDNFFKKGVSIKTKENLVKKIYINRAITHFRWR
jgi:ribosomal protein S7